MDYGIMGTSNYFSNMSVPVMNEQRMLEGMIQESIKINGMNVFYMPRSSYGDIDKIWGERPDSFFDKAYNIEMYLETPDGWQGQNDVFDKFGMNIQDRATFTVSRMSFERYVPTAIAKHPREGDLIYAPLMHALFEIVFSEDEKEFFALGKRAPYSYMISCEKFRFSNESIETGIKVIDDIEVTQSQVIQLVLTGVTSNNYNIAEEVYQGTTLASATSKAEVKGWDIANSKLQIINFVGTFTDGEMVIGANTNTQYALSSYSDQQDWVKNDSYQNREFEAEAEDFIITTETNPHGVP
jgi:hypothetical protein